MEEINQSVIESAILIVQMLKSSGHQIAIDGDVYVVNTTTATINGKNSQSRELWCGRERCTAMGAMNVIQRYHNAIINM